MSRRGWFGDSAGHSLAGRGVKFKRKGVGLSDPLYFAHRREMDVPFSTISDLVRKGLDYRQMMFRLRSEDPEDVRRRGIMAVEGRNADGMLSALDRQGVDMSVRMAEESPKFKSDAIKVLRDRQASSFLVPEKREELMRRLRV